MYEGNGSGRYGVTSGCRELDEAPPGEDRAESNPVALGEEGGASAGLAIGPKSGSRCQGFSAIGDGGAGVGGR